MFYFSTILFNFYKSLELCSGFRNYYAKQQFFSPGIKIYRKNKKYCCIIYHNNLFTHVQVIIVHFNIASIYKQIKISVNRQQHYL